MIEQESQVKQMRKVVKKVLNTLYFLFLLQISHASTEMSFHSQGKGDVEPSRTSLVQLASIPPILVSFHIVY